LYVLTYVGAGLTVIWGIAHLSATRGVVAGFGDPTVDSRPIISMEWIVEGVALVLVGAFVAAAATIDARAVVSATVYAVAIAMLVVLSSASLATGFKIRFLPFRLRPVIFMLSGVRIALGAWL
jgi:hypothetical protein